MIAKNNETHENLAKQFIPLRWEIRGGQTKIEGHRQASSQVDHDVVQRPLPKVTGMSPELI